MNSPQRNNRYLEENDEILFDQRVRHEKEERDTKIQNLMSFVGLSKKSIQDLHKFEKDTIENINNYKRNALDKYAQKVAAGLLSAAEAEKKAAKAVNDYIYIQKHQLRAKEKQEEYKEIEDRKLASKQADLDIFKAKKEHNVYLKKFELDSQRQKIDAIKSEYDVKKKYLEKQVKDDKKSKKEAKKDLKKLNDDQAKEMRKEGASELEIMQATGKLSAGAVKEAVFSKETASAVANNLLNGLKQMFDNTIQTYGTYQSKINTRLQGSGNSWNGFFGIGGIESKIKNSIGTNPYVKLQAVMDNVVKATEAGIANNVEQRAFLETISENIASTFDAFDANLLRVIRVQQADSTAARLGMEAGLTNFLNNYFKDNSYLNSAFDTVSQNLFEATSQLTAEKAVGVEYQIQKWLGSLYSVGFSDSAVSKISQALGYLGSGNISALSSDSTMQNLMVMAMNKANLSYGDLMSSGLTESTTNSLLKSMVEYLEEIANSDNKIVKSQYAEVFGMTVSDLEAAKNLTSSIKDIAKSSMNYASSVGELYNQMNQLVSRVSVAGMMQNLYDNFNYSIGTSIASNPVTYALWQITSTIEDLTGGIPLPTFSYIGNMVDLNTTVTNLMRAGIVGVSTLGGIGSILSGISSTFAPSSMLSKLGISGSTAQRTARGKGLNRTSNIINDVSGSTYIGNSSGDDYYNQTLTSANDDVDKTISQKKAESTDITLNNVHEYLLSVFDPKITEIEKMVALLAGYKVTTNEWSNTKFTGDISKTYNATTVTVSDSDKSAISNRDILSSIRENSTNIVEILREFRDSGIKISGYLGAITAIGLGG